MHRFDFEKRAKKVFDSTLKLLLNKSSDYAPEEDIYNGMKLCENLGICTLEKGILVRMTDKIGRLSNLIDHIKVVHNESTLDTVKDLLGYACLLYVYMEKNIEDSVKSTEEEIKEYEVKVHNALKDCNFAATENTWKECVETDNSPCEFNTMATMDDVMISNYTSNSPYEKIPNQVA